MSDPATPFEPIAARMQQEGLPEIAVRTFEQYYRQLAAGGSGMIDRSMIQPVESLPDLETLEGYAERGREALGRCVAVKLNGGLGTGMGLQKAKSLLPAKDDHSFLEIIVRQVMALRDRHGVALPLVFMNSFNTEADTVAAVSAIEGWEEGQEGIPVSFLQHKVPKLTRDTLEAVEWPADPGKEWCPPGHGDIYTALVTSGLLDRLVDSGKEYAFVSNADNLGAVLDLEILGYFAEEGAPFLMEVADRTAADRKGGHLARSVDGQYLLREVAQCPEDETEEFQDISVFRYFNTNTLWIHLGRLREHLARHDGLMTLPLIVNNKTVDPKDKTSTPVYQLETAMGSAIAVFPGAAALRVPRTRFAPVKATSDLLPLWSDIYTLNESWEVVRNPERGLGTIVVQLDADHYKMIDDFQARFPAGAPSLVRCSSLKIEGDVRFGEGVVLEGDVILQNRGEEQQVVPDGERVSGVGCRGSEGSRSSNPGENR